MTGRPTVTGPTGTVLAVAVFLVLAIYLSRTLVVSDDEAGYLSLGYLALRGEISLYQDEIAGGGSRCPSTCSGCRSSLGGPISGPDASSRWRSGSGHCC